MRRFRSTKPSSPKDKRIIEAGSGIGSQWTYLSLRMPTEPPAGITKSHCKAHVASPVRGPKVPSKSSGVPFESLVRVLLNIPASPLFAPGVTTVSVKEEFSLVCEASLKRPRRFWPKVTVSPVGTPASSKSEYWKKWKDRG